MAIIFVEEPVLKTPTAIQTRPARTVPAPAYIATPRLSISQMTTYRWSFDEDVTAYRSAGVPAIGVWRKKLEDYGEERGADLLREQGMAVSSLSFAGGFTGADGHSFQESLDDALDAVRIAGEIQAACLVVVSGSRAGHTANHARRLLDDALQSLGDAAAEAGIQIALLPMHRSFGSRWTFLSSTDSTLDALDRCDHPHVGMALDLFQMWREPNFAVKIPQLAPWIRMVLVSDSPSAPRSDHDRFLPGEGVMPLAGLLQELERAGYAGWHELQVISERLWDSEYRDILDRGLSAIRRIWPRSAERAH